MKIEDCERKIKELESKREQLGKKQVEFVKFQRREYLAQQAADRLEQIYEVFAEDSRKQIEELTKKELRSLLKQLQLTM